MITNSSLYEWLSHPLLLLLVGAIISSYLIPALTRRWQDHQKELELRTTLVGEISESVMRMIMAIQFVVAGAPSRTQEDFDQAFLKWSVDSSVIGSKLWAYFPKTNIPTDWETYTNLVSEFYGLTGIRDVGMRDEWLNRMRKQHFLASQTSIDWKSLIDGKGEKYGENWHKMRDEILSRKGFLLQEILEARLSGFR